MFLTFGDIQNSIRLLVNLPQSMVFSWSFNSTLVPDLGMLIFSCNNMHQEIKVLDSCGTYKVF